MTGVVTSRFELPRDRWGRPVLQGRTFERASSLGSALSDQTNLITWKAARVAEGLLARRDLLDSGLSIKDLAEAAAVAGGGDTGSDFGTLVHQMVASYFIDGEVRHGADL